MIESLGLGVTAEIPIVVVDVMRTGPSTGIATKTEQADLNIALYGLHGDAPHVVVAPNSVADCLAATQWAVHLAESLQVPAIVLSDQYFGQARAVVDAPGQRRLRAGAAARTGRRRRPTSAIALTDLGRLADGDSRHAGARLHRRRPRAQRARHSVIAGRRPSRADGQAQRASSRSSIRASAGPTIEGEGELAVLTWGSCTGPVREAFERARADGVKARLVSLRLLSPAQPARLQRSAARASSACWWSSRTSAASSSATCAPSTTCPARCTACGGPARCRSIPDEIHRKLLEWSRA